MGGAAPTATEVVTDTVKQEDVQLYIYERGQTEPYKSVDVTARVSGYLEQLLFRSGGLVKEGEQLAVIERDQYQIALNAAKAQLEVSVARANLAKSNLERAKQLLETRAMAEEDVQSRQAEYDVALATIELNKSSVQQAELNLQYTDIRAPFTGKASKNLVDIGNYISPSSVSAKLLSIAQIDPIFVDFQISDKQFADLKERMGFRQQFDKMTQNDGNPPEGEPVAENSAANPAVSNAVQPDAPNETILPSLTGTSPENAARIDISLTTGTDVMSVDFPLNGRITALVDNRITKETGQITLRAEVRNPLLTTNGNEDYMLYPGQICRVRIPYEKVKGAVLVDESAILTDLDTKYVLVVEKGMVEKKTPMGQPMLGPDGQPLPAEEGFLVHRRDIQFGRLLDTQQRIVLGGLKPGETYIVKGVQRVRIGSAVSPITLEEFNKRRAEAE